MATSTEEDGFSLRQVNGLTPTHLTSSLTICRGGENASFSDSPESLGEHTLCYRESETGRCPSRLINFRFSFSSNIDRFSRFSMSFHQPEHPATGDGAYSFARERYAAWGVDTDAVLKSLSGISVSLHCWQGDDVGGFENQGTGLTGGIAVTGNYPGRATTPDELRNDLELVLKLLPGKKRLALHASYAEYGGRRVERNEVDAAGFTRWIDWAKSQHLGLDFNPTYFSHPKSTDGFTLAHADSSIRNFWIEHGIACRKIGEQFGRSQGTPCINNFWIPDGFKDTPADRRTPRERLVESLDEIFREPIDPAYNRDSVEAKLFGIGSESYVVGSHEFYLGYAITRKKLLCLDAGHFHPTESIADKISSVLNWVDELLLHVSRGIRWDSDHVVIGTDDLHLIAGEVVRNGYLNRVHFGLDFFDASINRIAAWVIGARALQKAILVSLLEPTAKLREAELKQDFTSRLAWQEELKSMPWGIVWNHYCETQGVPPGGEWLDNVRKYEQDVLSQRNS